jgi:predicted nucleotidyltransferase
MQDDVSRLLGCGVDVVDSEALERERYFANEVQKDMVAI